jgi:cyclic 2,3-diphosphoglycerate synthetase
MRYLAIIDGEHYAPVVEETLTTLERAGHEVLAALMVGGKEKLPVGGVKAYGDIPVRVGDDPRLVLDAALRELTPDAVVDLSDEPVLDYRRRMQLAAIALFRNVVYKGADFEFQPPHRPRLCNRPSLALIATGKRAGKTAVAGYVARTAGNNGIHPVVVAMGRGGPQQPELLRGDQISLEPKDLLELADAGKHAASDYVEDAVLGRVPTVGCRRCGGGLAGQVYHSNVPEGIALANGIEADLTILEGSGAALPPAYADVTGLIVPASVDPEYLRGYMGPYKLLLADFVVVTMSESPFGSPSDISSLTSTFQQAFRLGRDGEDAGDLRVVRTVFRPQPTRSVSGARVFVATTAPEAAGPAIERHLEDEHGCEVVGISHSLSDRERLEGELKDIADKAEVMLCEIKAAAIDVATRRALDVGLDVIYMDNVPMGVDGDDLEEVVVSASRLARDRFEADRTRG